MQMQIVVDGKGSITISQKVDVDTASLQKLAKHAVELLSKSAGRASYGFSAGSSLDTEVSDG